MHQQHTDPRVGLVLVGFGDPRRLAPIAGKLGWQGLVLSDPTRTLYTRLGLGRAPLWRIYTPKTLLTYARGVRRPGTVTGRPDEDTRQLGGDAILADGLIVRLWRPRSPDDRPPAREVLDEASRLLA